jgi:hypothetical protein
MPEPPEQNALPIETGSPERRQTKELKKRAKDNLALVILVLAAIIFTVLLVLFEPERFWTNRTRWALPVLILLLVLVATSIERLNLQKKIFPVFGTISVVVALGSIALWLPYANDQIAAKTVAVQREFYATVAQVLPVLLLAAIVDIHESSKVSATQVTSYLLVVVTGEFWALYALGFDLTTDPFPYAVVCAALTGAVLGLAIALYGRRYGEKTGRER